MTLQDFKSSLDQPEPPTGIGQLLLALWYDGKGDWDASHNVAQEIHTHDGSWIHAYLHRKEGDAGNAAYWYSRASKPVCKVSLQQEWEQLVSEFLKK
jgi:hypothetical protein